MDVDREVISKLRHTLRTPLNAIAVMAEMLEEVTALSPQQSVALDRIQDGSAELLERFASLERLADFAALNHGTVSDRLVTPAGRLAALELQPDQAEYIEILVGSTHDLQAIVREVSDFARAASAEGQATAAPFSLRPAVEAAAAHALLAADVHDVSTQLDSGHPAIVRGSRPCVERLLELLLVRAARVGADGRALLEVAAVGGAAQLCFKVFSPAVRLPAEALESEIELASALQTRHGDRTDSAGLTLALAARLSTLMDGRLTVEQNDRAWLEAVLPLPAASRPAEEGVLDVAAMCRPPPGS